jgi:type I restriction enzyme M protein
MNFYKFLDSLRNIMRKDRGVTGDAQRIEQLSWIFFLKIFDDIENENVLILTNYNSIIKKKFQWKNWAADAEGITGDNLIKFINNELFPYLKNLKNSNLESIENIIHNCFEGISNYMSNGTLLRQLINKINEIDFKKKEDFEVFGTVYEEFLRLLQSAGDAGEFYTPRALTQFIVNKLSPKINDVVLDPACGTGGFITALVDYHRKNNIKSIIDSKKIEKNIRGVEAKPLPYILSITNMFLHRLNTPYNIRRGNILEKPLREYSYKDQVDIIITNPPFGGAEVDGIELNVPANIRTKETAKLFLSYIVEILKNKGRAGIVLPDGTLSDDDPANLNIKENLLSQCNLHTIIKLPDSVFQPYAGVSTNILFFEKGTSTEGIWYYEMPLPEGRKSFNKTKPITYEDLIPIEKWFNNKKNGNNSWYVTLKELKKRNYNLDQKNPLSKINFVQDSHLIESLSNDEKKINELFKKIDYTKIKNANNQVIALDFLFDFEEGTLQSSKCIPGNYNFITASESWKTHNSFSHDCEALVLAAKASGSLGNMHHVNGKFMASGLCYVLKKKNNLFISMKFYYYFFQFIKQDFVYRTKSGTSKKVLDITKIKNYKILYFEEKTQLELLNYFELLDSLRDSLLQTSEKIDFIKNEKIKQMFNEDTVSKIWSN